MKLEPVVEESPRNTMLQLVKQVNEQREVIKLLTAAVIEQWRQNDPEVLDVIVHMLRHSTGVDGKESIF